METAEQPDHDIRCDCGKLIARWKDQGFEVKCQRCKRHHQLACPGHAVVPPTRPPLAHA
jgi:phage FluMu protein Com